ncbi:MAG TPA: sugar ABC transporter substrate-binding protein [Clostridia bacterium]
MNRRLFTCIIVILMLTLTLASCSPASSTNGQTTAPAKDNKESTELPYKGVTLNIPAIDWLGSQVMRELSAEFEQETGAKVVWDILETSALQEKVFLTINGKAGTYDIITADATWTAALAVMDGLEPMPVEEWKADKDFDFDDLYTTFTDAYGDPTGRTDNVYFIPMVTDVMGMYYRSDLFEQYADEFKKEYGYDLKVPEYWDEFLDIAKFFTRDTNGDGEIDLYGTTMMAAPVAIASDYIVYANSWGFDYFTEDLRPNYTDPKSIEAITFYIDLYRKWKVVPPSVPNNWFSETQLLMQRGQVATSVNWAAFCESTNDPAQSEYAGKILFAPLPRARGVESSKGLLAGHCYAINKYSKNLEAAKAYMTWALSKPVQDKLAMRGVTGSRYSSSINASSKYPWMKNFAEAVLTGKHWVPRMFPDFMSIHQVVMSDELSKALMGEQTVEEALNKVQQRVDQLMREGGYY